MRQSMGAGDSAEIAVAQLQLDGVGMQASLPETAADHLREARQCSFELLGIGSVAGKRMLMAHGFRVLGGTNFRIEPAAGIESAGLAGQRQTPFAEAVFQERIVEFG